MRYTDKQIEELSINYVNTCDDILWLHKICFLYIKNSNKETHDYLQHGILMRADILRECIQNIYDIFPLNEKTPLTEEYCRKINIYVQCFIFNLYGYLDNLANFFVKIKNITVKGSRLKKSKIGFSKKYAEVRGNFSDGFQKYLKRLDEWFEYLEDCRHTLAHRIPPYVPTYEIPNENNYVLQLQQKKDALRKLDFVTYEKIEEEIRKTSHPCFLMSYHDKDNNEKHIAFHAQILADWNTIIDITKEFFAQPELQRILDDKK